MDTALVYQIDREARRVRVIYRAQPTFEQWEQTMETVFRDPAYEAGFGILLDRSRVPRAASREYIHRMVTFIEGHAAQTGHARWALLVVDVASFGMAELAQSLASSGKIRAFLLSAEARAWLEAGSKEDPPLKP